MKWEPVVHRQGKLCGHVREASPGSWATDCSEGAEFVRADEDGMTEYACARHAAESN